LSHELAGNYGRLMYSVENAFHSSFHSYSKADLDSLGETDQESLSPLFKHRGSFLYRKLFEEHLIEVERPDYSIYFDFMPDFQIGREFSEGKATWLNTRGFSLQ